MKALQVDRARSAMPVRPDLQRSAMRVAGGFVLTKPAFGTARATRSWNVRGEFVGTRNKRFRVFKWNSSKTARSTKSMSATPPCWSARLPQALRGYVGRHQSRACRSGICDEQPFPRGDWPRHVEWGTHLDGLGDRFSRTWHDLPQPNLRFRRPATPSLSR